MITKEIAAILDGMEYGEGIKEQDREYAKVNGVVIVSGASDDLMELDGAIQEEVGCYGENKAYLDKNGLIVNKCDNEDCPYFQEKLLSAKVITAIWDSEGYAWSEGYSWIYETEIPHETFEILENGETYCRGIVFSMGDLE